MKTLPVLIDAATLATWSPQDVLRVDCRVDLGDPGKGRRAYEAGHLPGAVYADLEHDLSDLDKRAQGLGRHPLPDIADFTAVLGRWGWKPGLRVVAYDAAGSALAAARLWWMIRLVGGEACVLEGGIDAWTAAGFALEQGVVSRESTRVDVAFNRSQVLLTDDLQRHRKAGDALVLDARAAPRFRGEVEPLDPVAGHVPGALNRPFADNLDADGRFLPARQLRSAFEALLEGWDPRHVVHMCGSGVTACHNLLAMEHAGLPGSRLYAPSWSGWVSDSARPVATGPG